MDLDDASLRKLAVKVSESQDSAAVLMNKSGSVVCACSKASKHKANELLKKVLDKLGGNGGGNEQIASGKVKKVEMISF